MLYITVACIFTAMLIVIPGAVGWGGNQGRSKNDIRLKG